MKQDAFHVGQSPLHSGITLLEASAGTGKTYAIEAIFLRLLLETGLRLEQILVVTFTEAATQELRVRIRRRLRDAYDQVRSGIVVDDALGGLKDFSKAKLEQSGYRLWSALEAFDEAQIFTIHGFCARVLGEHAFESGSHFDTSLVTDERALYRQVTNDFRRRFLYGRFPYLAGLLSLGIRFPDDYLGVLQAAWLRIDAVLIPSEPEEDLPALESAVASSLARIGDLWNRCGDEALHLLSDASVISQSAKNFRQDRREHLQMDMHLVFVHGKFFSGALSSIAKLSSSSVDRAMHKRVRDRGDRIVHPLFSACEELGILTERILLKALYTFRAFVDSTLPVLKESRNVRTYDDLLSSVYQSIGEFGGGQLAATVRERYGAALIDEFQDTDPVQWAIFRRLFERESHRLYLIGDPKQAIYAFRGADVFTYLDAARHSDAVYTLGRNYRSSGDLVTAVNAIFRHRPNPFLFPDIGFSPATAHREATDLRLGSAFSPAPLQILTAGSDPTGFYNKEEAARLVIDHVVWEITRLLAAPTQIDGRRLHAGDIAVLVRKNRQAEQVQSELLRFGVHSVIYTESSVYDTSEAKDLLHFLSALLNLTDERLLRGALATFIFSCSGDTIHELSESDSSWQIWREKYVLYRDLWFDRGFMFLYRTVLAAENIRERVLRFSGGERTMTNLGHLAELIHRREVGDRMAPESLVQWLHQQRADAGVSTMEESQLRMESDELAVQIVTAHKSKGLEYPVVFCPFHWDNARFERQFPATFHAGGEPRMTIALMSVGDLPPEDRDQAFREDLSTEIRLLYVTLTRARTRCYLYWVPTRMGHQSPLYSVLCGGDPGGDSGAELLQISDRAGGAIALTDLVGQYRDGRTAGIEELDCEGTEAKHEFALGARQFQGRIDRRRMMVSFTGLTNQGVDEDTGHGDVPSAATNEVDRRSQDSIFAFPRGPTAGNFFHSVLQEIDFTETVDLEGRVQRHLKLHGFDLEEKDWTPVAAGIIRTLLQLPLSGDEARRSILLGEIGWNSRLSEAEFYYPIKTFSQHALAECFSAHGADGFGVAAATDIGRLRIDPAQGYMRGFIDLIFEFSGRFYLLDWKSNWLGDRIDAYGESELRAAMIEQRYYLQRMIYCVALDRYLARRIVDYDFDSHFGGAYYVFLRGVSLLRPGHGVVFDRPSRTFIGSLCRLIMPPLGGAQRENDE